MKLCYLYKITNLVNGKLYIGITNNPSVRFRDHLFNRHKKTISLVAKAIDKYGKENIKFEILCIGSLDYIRELETKAIISYNTTAPNGYNIRSGGEGGSGHKIIKRSDDNPIFVSGFWFPSLRFAVSSLCIGASTIQSRLKVGTAGDVTHRYNTHRDSKRDFVYVGGFWFNCLKQASLSLNIKIPTLRKRLYTGFIEAEKPPMVSGEDHKAYGKRGINAKPISICGVKYPSQAIASEQTGIPPCTLYRKLKQGHPDFKFVVEE